MIELHVLGPVRAERDGRPLHLGGPRQRTVLARLIVADRRTVTADQLVDAVWGDRPPPTARKTLQKYVSQLRKSLHDDDPAGRGRASRGWADGVIATRNGGYSLTDGCAVDVDEARRLLEEARRAHESSRLDDAADALRSALGLWDGEAYGDVDAVFAEPERTRLGELHLAAAHHRLEVEVERGRHLEVLGDIEDLADANPDHEGVWLLLLEAFVRCGRPADALRAYERLRRHLADELGIEPSAALRRFQAGVLRGEPVG